eukprot:TRINITY_DN9602_c0_g1_i3.p1 TRINITY_DN9602_c0_g1~~TRINITY_DN9602_c0_g1_i3.p1  ORF type:complete len:226 (-),score=47.75 TRINITY_DN9602_c0_g1_i3:205-882(-)
MCIRDRVICVVNRETSLCYGFKFILSNMKGRMKAALKDVKANLNNYKGVHFDTENQRYQDRITGAHFEYNDLCRRLNVLLKRTTFKAVATASKKSAEDPFKKCDRTRVQVLKDRTNNPRHSDLNKRPKLDKVVVHKVQKSLLPPNKKTDKNSGVTLEKTRNKIQSKYRTRTSLIKENRADNVVKEKEKPNNKVSKGIKMNESMRPKSQSGAIKSRYNAKANTSDV